MENVMFFLLSINHNPKSIYRSRPNNTYTFQVHTMACLFQPVAAYPSFSRSIWLIDWLILGVKMTLIFTFLIFSIGLTGYLYYILGS